MEEGKKPPIEGPLYVPQNTPEIDYRRGHEAGGGIVVALELMEVAPNFPRPSDTPQRFHVFFDNVPQAIRYFQSLALRLREFSP